MFNLFNHEGYTPIAHNIKIMAQFYMKDATV